MDELGNKSTADLLALYPAIIEELRRRDVVRSANCPTGDLAEYLYCRAFNWDQEANSKKAYDAVDKIGQKYQIKARRMHTRNKSRVLSAIRTLNGFDYLAAILFEDDYNIKRGALIPAAVVEAHVRFVKHTNSNRFVLRDVIWDEPGVRDTTDKLNSVRATLF